MMAGSPSAPPTGADLLRRVGLLVDGPVEWGRPVPAPGPGVYVVELPAPRATAPIDASRVGKWLERVSTLRLDGERPTTRALLARLAAYWLADQVVVFVGAAGASVGGRVAALRTTSLGDRRPYAGGQWLATLEPAAMSRARVWWSATTATEEYEDALLTAFAETVPAASAAATREPGLVLPWAVLRRPTGERRDHGLTGATLVEPASAPPPAKTTRVMPEEPAAAPRSSLGGVRPARRPSGRRVAAAATRAREVVELSAEGYERAQAELHELRTVRRPAVVARVAAARELGDLRENAEYHAAREELGFVEGRIQALEGRLRVAVVVEAGGGSTATIGSTVVVELDGERLTYRLVGTAESDPKAGRISTGSPVGRALVGRSAGDEAVVRIPGGAEVRYRVVEVG